jgi:adenosyl cobinamide kinase/adenosyl cobinamide phosphate guanylyltransferase
MALVVLTGGARSGKSAIAQELARVRFLDGHRVVAVVFGDESQDAEMTERIVRHRADRPQEFRVVEAADCHSWMNEVADDEVVLLDCLGTLLARALDEELALPARVPDSADTGDVLPEGLAAGVESRVDAIIDEILARAGDTIVVTNEVGGGVVPAYASGRLFRDVLGRANRRLVQSADAAYVVICGRALDLTALPTSVRWPSD